MAHLIGLLVAVAAIASPERAAAHEGVPEQQRRLMALGATLGDARLEVLAWSTSGDTKRLRVLGFDEGTAKGKIGGYVVIDDKALSPQDIEAIRAILLDPSTYEHADIRRPVPPSKDGLRYGVGKGCGGFRPFLAVSLTDAEGRSGDVFVCLTCNEVEFRPVATSGRARRDTEVRKPLGPPPKGAVRKYLSKDGALRLAEFALALYPDDEAIAWERDKRRAPPSTESRPTSR
jgi:hypothetical protein